MEVIDEADFRKPVDYGSAVVTLSDWRENGPGKFCIYEKDTAVDVTVTVDSAGAEAGLRIENKVEPVTGMLLYPDIKPTRLGMNLNLPATHVVMRTFIVPAAAPREKR
ncbi:hypothetical protein OPIT5_08635 [Opitutaceae bacterium TAV5]|nr:hypothetical protein OPIT5_08635 [Opitutaceae bacterium TAV5]